ncbi:MAG: ABC transporter substrate-binding protein [Rhodobacteraceae bacterium]|jgi:NitT/TauT family transport system substrate-binding protein|nr:ABC transporter substrate-binding protein [Paracoccaceae bacterium]
MSLRTLALALAPAAGLAAGTAGAQTAVIFGTNWVAQAEHGGYYQALADGTYAACGLDVTILPGGPQVNNRALLVAGRIDFYMGGPVGVLSAVQEGIPMVAVAADFQKDPQILMTHPGRVASFAEVSGLPQYFIGDEGFVTYFRWLEAAHGFDPARRVPYTFNPAPFVANPDSAQQGYVTSEPFAVQRAGGFMPDVWLLADQGYPAYSQLIVAMKETLERRPEVVRCFVEATSIGWANFLHGDNSAALAAIRRDNPDMTAEQLANSLDAIRRNGLVDSGDAATLGIGAMTALRWEAFAGLMAATGVIPPDLDHSRAYSLGFALSGASLPVLARLRGN